MAWGEGEQMHEKHGKETEFLHVRKYSRQKCTAFQIGPLSYRPISLAVVGALTMEGDGGAVMLSIVHLAYTNYPFLLPSNNNKFQKGEDKCSFILTLHLSRL